MRSGDPLSLISTRRRPLLASGVGSLLFLMSASAGFGQLATLEPGSRVRISAPLYGIENAVGTVQDAPTGALVVGFESVPPPQGATAWTLRNSNITDLEVSIDQRRYGFRGFGIGFFSGLLVGAVAGLLTAKSQSDGFDFGDNVILYARALGIVGGATGLVLGSLKQTDVWVPTSREPSMSSAGQPPLSNGVPRLELGFALRF